MFIIKNVLPYENNSLKMNFKRVKMKRWKFYKNWHGWANFFR